jgi:hypothetical protein
MISEQTRNFLEMVQVKFEFTAEELANPQLIFRTTGIKFQTGYDHERYKAFSAAIKRVCHKISDCSIELDERLNIEGLQPRRDGPLMQFVPSGGPVRLYRSDLDIHPEVFTDEYEVPALAYILTMWQNSFMQQVDPEVLIRERLKQHGIFNWADFEANRERLMITNPFPNPHGLPPSSQN